MISCSSVVVLAVLFSLGDLRSPSRCRSNSDAQLGYNDTSVHCDFKANQSCFQLAIPPNKERPGARIYGCISDLELPTVYSKTKFWKGFYSPRYELTLEGRRYIGAIKLCAVNLCNELDFVYVEPLKQRASHFLTRYLEHLYPFLIMVALSFVSVYPVIKSYAKSKQFRRQEFAEIGKEEVVVQEVTGRLPTLADVNFVIEKLQFPTTADQDNAQPLRDEEVAVNIPENEGKTAIKTVMINKTVRSFEKDKSGYIRPIRSAPSKRESLLHRLLEHGPGLFTFNPEELGDLFSQAADIFAAEPTLLCIPADSVVVYGDLKGQYPDLHRWFHIHGYPPCRRRHVFLGGLINPANDFSLETVALVVALKIALPNDVYVLRGASEALTYTIQRRFPRKICRALSAVISQMCSHMPLAAVIGEKILAMHGGPTPLLENMEEIQKIPRPLMEFEKNRVSSHLIFSDPSHEVDGFKVKKHGRGVKFGEKAVEKFCSKMSIDLIIRARNPSPGGCFMMGNKKLLSLFSAPGNNGCIKGATALISAANGVLNLQIIRLASCGTLKTPTVGDSMRTTEKLCDFLIREAPLHAQAQMTSLDGTAEKNATRNIGGGGPEGKMSMCSV
ncbi:hypothetical protein QR680_006770 [Steinernema hermaphroditum]|uniref:Serine/threonine specific protein phosphatases domain-containing protein n=1 Tax=Steinernema hermaphroditum TaxID=289476 RepID=A0AA39HXX7_9BILA|nr:hypothetical protein QR680_006770 [Steinernema hermaphroditum]